MRVAVERRFSDVDAVGRCSFGRGAHRLKELRLSDETRTVLRTCLKSSNGLDVRRLRFEFTDFGDKAVDGLFVFFRDFQRFLCCGIDKIDLRFDRIHRLP